MSITGGDDIVSGGLPCNLQFSLFNYDLTRKVFAVTTMDTLSVLIAAEAANPTPNLAAITALSASLSSLLSSVS